MEKEKRHYNSKENSGYKSDDIKTLFKHLRSYNIYSRFNCSMLEDKHILKGMTSFFKTEVTDMDDYDWVIIDSNQCVPNTICNLQYWNQGHCYVYWNSKKNGKLYLKLMQDIIEREALEIAVSQQKPSGAIRIDIKDSFNNSPWSESIKHKISFRI